MGAAPFKIGMYLPELHMPFDASLAEAKAIGAEYVWFNRLPGETPIAAMSDEEVDRMHARVDAHDLKLFLIGAGNPFKQIHLCDLDLDTFEQHPEFRSDLRALVRSMEIAVRLGVKTVNVFTFAWPGEYNAGRPTWPMRWLTRGGVIADIDMEKLVRIFSLVLQHAEAHDVDVAFSMMPWNYTNTSNNFRALVERLDSPRLKVMWGPADNYNCGELDTATMGFRNLRPYLHGLHVKDLHVIDGLRCKFEYKPFGTGDIDYMTVLRQVRESGNAPVLSLSTHFVPASGSHAEAMRTNYANLQEMIQRIENGG